MHLVRVDEKCTKCGFHNMIKMKSESYIEIIACGRCGNLLHVPDDFDEEDIEIVNKLVKEELKNASMQKLWSK